MSPGYRCQLPRIPRSRTRSTPSADGVERPIDSSKVHPYLRESDSRRSSASPSPVKKCIKLSPPSANHHLTGLKSYLRAMQDGQRVCSTGPHLLNRNRCFTVTGQDSRTSGAVDRTRRTVWLTRVSAPLLNLSFALSARTLR